MLPFQKTDPFSNTKRRCMLDSLTNRNRPEADLLRNLPQEIMIDILSRLPVGSILWSKCVCKSWRDLIECSEFIITHHHRSTSSAPATGLALIENMVDSKKAFKICDEVDVDRCTTISNFALPTQLWVRAHTSKLSSANCLLLVAQTIDLHDLFICNPITREYIHVLPPEGPSWPTFGFGMSKITGLWRSIATCRHSDGASDGALVNGNLHWLGFDFDVDHQKRLISCFDLETEQFTSFSIPPRKYCLSRYTLSDLKGHLCLSESLIENEIVIWSMNKYGDDKSWAKEYIINTRSIREWQIRYGYLYPVRVFKDSGDILLGVDTNGLLFIYSNEDKNIQKYDHVQVEAALVSSNINYNPSFLSLKAMGFQNVASLDTTLNHVYI